MKRLLFKIGIVLCAFFAVLPVRTAYAAVDFTSDGAADQSSVYVAGAPDSFPVESYDADSGKYIGAAPDFLSLVAEQTGLDFVYIRAGEQDRRESLVKNSQIDLIFASGDERELLNLGVEKSKLFSVTKNGMPTDVFCVFTSVSDEKERAAVRSVAERLTKDDVAKLLTSDSTQSVNLKKYSLALIVLGSAIVCAFAALAFVLILFFKRRQKKEVLADALTGIDNKVRFIQNFASEISDQTRELYNVVYFAFDVAWVNNNDGNEESDAILRYAAHTITKLVKENEFCARVGGGAFAAAIHSNGGVPVEKRVEEILRELNAYGGKKPSSEGKMLFQAGICALTIDDKDAEKVLYNAEQAYRCALRGKKECVVANRDILKEYRAKAFIRETARDALEKRSFTPYLQFIVNADDGTICGGEILSRWETRAFGLLSPGRYIPILQDIGLIVRHDLFMMEEACKLLEQWHSCGKNYFLNCNLTRVTVSDPTLVDQLLSITGRYHFPQEKLILEVTEDSLEADKDNALKNILRLKENGFRIALDDFSSGYTTVANLYEYSVDLVKLDRQIILAAERDPQAASLMKEITRLCHELQVSVLAEGVETEEQVRQIRSVHCDYIQGYFYARALPLRELNGFEENYKAKAIPAPAELIEAPETVPIEVSAANPLEISAEEAPGTPVEEVPETLSEKPLEVSAAMPVITHEPPKAEAPVTPEPPKMEVPIAPEKTRQAESPVLPETPSLASGQADKHMIHIQFGPYRLDLPANIDIDPVSEILRAIQEKMD